MAMPLDLCAGLPVRAERHNAAASARRGEDMAEELVYDACLEVRSDGACLAQLCDMPACFARGADETEALRILEACIPAYFAWLARHDEYTPVMRGPFRVAVAEALRAADPPTGAFLQSDAQPVSGEDRDWYLALLDW